MKKMSPLKPFEGDEFFLIRTDDPLSRRCFCYPARMGPITQSLLGVGGGIIGSLGKDWIAAAMKRRGGFHTDIGVCAYVAHGKWDIDRQDAELIAPMFLNYELNFIISNRSSVDRQIIPRSVHFCEKEPKRDKKSLHLNTSLHPLGMKVTADEKEDVQTIKIAPRGMVAIRIKGTATTPVMGGLTFKRWRWVAVTFKTADDKDFDLWWDIAKVGDTRTWVPDEKPMFEVPQHYVTSQAAKLPFAPI